MTWVQLGYLCKLMHFIGANSKAVVVPPGGGQEAQVGVWQVGLELLI